MLTSYETFSVKNFNGNDHLSNSIIIDKDIDLRYLYVDDKNETIGARSSFFGSYWYCVGKVFLSRGKYRYSLRRDVFQPLDILLANNNTKLTEPEQLTKLNDRWLREDAYIERGKASNELRYRKDNLPLNKIKVAQHNIIPSQPMIGIFYNQRQDDEGILKDFDLEGQIGSNIVADYEEETIEEGTFTYIDTTQLSNAYIDGDTGYGINLWYKQFQNLNPTRLSDINSTLTDMTKTINYDKGYGASDIQGISVTGALIPKIVSNNQHGKQHSSINDIIYSYQNYRFTNAQIQAATSNKLGYGNISTVLEGTVKVGTKYYKRSIEVINPLDVTLSKADLKPLLATADLRLIADNDNKGQSWNLKFKVAAYKVTIEEQEELVFETKKVKADNIYPMMKNSPIRCLLVDYTDENIRWATSVTRMPEVVSAQVIKYVPAKWRNSLTLQDSSDDIESYILTEDDVTFTYTLPTPIGAGNKEYSIAKINSGSFMNSLEIDLYQNDGLEKFDITYRVKPMGTTYYIIPHYSGIYGSNFSDKRGLIEQEDLLITDMNDTWLNQQYENRNMFNTFNRQQESLELQQGWEQKLSEHELKISKHEAIAAQGQTWANYSGNLPLIGGLVNSIGMAHGLAGKGSVFKDVMEGAKLDHQMGQELRADTYAMQAELFNFGIGNIKAISPTISRLDSFDNKTIFGFIIEIFETSQAEKELVDNYKKWNGEPINASGRFIDYIDYNNKHLIRGTLVKSTYPPYIIKEMNEALKGGIYVI